MIRADTTEAQSIDRAGFTILELLVTFTIIGILLALLLPAVQSSRESVRRVHCANNLKQIGIAMLSHESNKGHFPTGGWGFRWVGDPRRGSGKDQPGGWVYCILPYIEQSSVHEIGSASVSDSRLRSELATLTQKSLPLFHCPSRRSSALYPTQWQAFNTDFVDLVAKTDYAANAGTVFLDVGPGPVSLEAGDSDTYPWPDYPATGICFLRSQVKVAEITDGTSNTILAGEKNLPRLNYASGLDRGDDQCMYSGDDYDTLRWANAAWPPVNDQATGYSEARFGSAHPSGCNLLLCDGSVRLASYTIDQVVYESLGDRNGATVVGDW
jgi:prepilin-type N-terminal cleavage/methylation domain-containing protein/prepilin-type processing-associated H-X9-DG protein